jgi:hypothetical protein
MPRVVPPPDLESSLLLLYNSIQFDRKSLTSPFSKDKKRGFFLYFEKGKRSWLFGYRNKNLFRLMER